MFYGHMKNSKQNKTKQKKSNDVLLETVIVVSLHEWGKKSEKAVLVLMKKLEANFFSR